MLKDPGVQIFSIHSVLTTNHTRMKKIYLVIFFLYFILSARMGAQCSTPSLVPYYESFSGITANNQLPPCWAVSSTVTCGTFLSGISNTYNSALFFSLPQGISYFYTNAILLQPGITYSATCWYRVDPTINSINWFGLSMSLSHSQSAAGATQIAATTGYVVQLGYTALTGTFTVANYGIYYLVLGANSIGASDQQYLEWDDLSVTIPCELNLPSISAVASPSAICAGGQVSLAASGANTYSWNTSQTTYSITDTPLSNTNYQVTGTSTLTGCSNSALVKVHVHPLPNVIAVAGSSAVCNGSPASLMAGGAINYTWSTGSHASNMQVNPTVTTSYSVTATDINGCVGTASLQITVNPLPTLSVAASNTRACVGDSISLTASGASSYVWDNGLFYGAHVSFKLAGVTTLTVVGTNANGCTGRQYITIALTGCTGIAENSRNQLFVRAYPNPCKDLVTVDLNHEMPFTLLLTDMMGKIVFQKTEQENKSAIDLSILPAGIYQLHVLAEGESAHGKIVKE